MSLSSGCPYPGLRPFKYQESGVFFGRESHKRDLRDKLGRNRFVAVIGSSGSGKSSLVRAGLLPMIDHEGASDAPKRWRWIIFRPGPDPIQSLVRRLREFARWLAPELVANSGDVLAGLWAAMLRGSSAGLVEIVAGLRRAAPSDAVPRRMAVLIVVDQFEEVFRFEDSSPSLSARQHREDTRALIRVLLAASDAPPGDIDVYVLTTMRSDFLGDCVKFAGLAEAVSDSQFLVPKLTRDQRRSAIVQPVAGRIEPELVQELLNATDEEADDLPVMQHALMRCWRQAAGGPTSDPKPELTLGDYDRIGGIEKALSNHADEIYRELTEGEQTDRTNTIEYLFRALTAIDANGRIIRRPQRFLELVQVTGQSRDLVKSIVDRFRQEDCSFLFPPPQRNANELNLEFSSAIQSGEELCDDTMVDLSHEALIRRWTMISDRTRDNLSGGQRGWVYREQRDAELWRALRVQAEAWQSDPRAVLSEETTRRRKEWFELLPADARRAWARRYALSLGSIGEKTAEGEAAEKEARQQYDDIARLIAESVAHVEKGLNIAGDLGERNLGEAEAVKRRLQDAEREVARHRSRSVILRACDPAHGAEPRTRLLVALEILGASSTSSAPPTPAVATPSTGPTTMADTGVSDYDPLRELKSTAGGAGGTSSRWTYVPEAEQAAYAALAELQAVPAADWQGGTSRRAEANRLYAPVELTAPTPNLGTHGTVQLEFGRIGTLRETLFFCLVPVGPAVSAATVWQTSARTIIKSFTSDGGGIADSYAATGRQWVVSANRLLRPKMEGENELGYTLQSWLEEPYTAAVSSSVAIVVDHEGRYALFWIENTSPSSPRSSAPRHRSSRRSTRSASAASAHLRLLATSTRPVRNTVWHVAFSLDGRRLLILSDALDGFGFECGSDGAITRRIEMHRQPLETGPILALDPARWRWARAVASGPLTSAAEGNDPATTSGGQVVIGGGVGSATSLTIPFHDLVSAAQFSPTGNRIILAPQHGELHLFDLADVSAPIARFGEPKDRFVAVAFSPTEDKLAAAHDDGRISIWSIFPTTDAIVAQARATLGIGHATAGLSVSQRVAFGLLDPVPTESDTALEPAELAVEPVSIITAGMSSEARIQETSPETSSHRAFVIMPFGKKKTADGTVIDFEAVYRELLAPAITAAGLAPHRADADRRGGSIHLDMFQDLLLAEFVVADLTIDNPNVWYEIGVRHALRAGGSVLTYALRDRLPFDIAGQRMQRYSLKEGKLAPDLIEAERTALKEAIEAALGATRGRRSSPVYQLLPSLREPDWKTLKIGDVNEFWQRLEAWQSRVEVARRKQRPGDILVLAEETPNSVLEFEALRTAARTLLRLNRLHYALSIIEHARQLDPDDVEARQIEGIALGRARRYEEARETLRRLAEERKDGETLGLLARTWKDEWTQLWNAHAQRKLDPLAAARETAGTLQSAASAYVEAFRAAPGDYYPGINALTLGRLWEHVTGQKSRLPLSSIAAGVGWTAGTAIERDKDYWSLVTRAELALIENREDAMDDYSEAAALAVANRDLFALDSSSQQLDFLGELKFHRDIVAKAALVIDRAEQQLRALLGSRPEEDAEPAYVVVFSGHTIDDPAMRGEGKEKPPFFPPEKIEAAASRIRAALDEVGAGAGDLGLCSGASGGDLLFAEACVERGMRVELRLARAEKELLAEPITFADRDHRWERSFAHVKENPATTVLVMPEELGPAPTGVSVHDRCNRWILYTALSQGLSRTSFVTLWNGEPGDGPGGTQNMVELVRKLTGRQPIIIDPTTL